MSNLQKLAAVIHTMPSKPYLNYLRSAQWKEMRAAKLRSADYICEVCHIRPAVQVHHWSYARLGQESSFDLCAVCMKCHADLHAAIKPANDNEPQGELFTAA
jgi:5-methylcytosine-specific restriction endonuclease McrA